MATYEEIYGKRVDVLDADPTVTSAYEGQVWYNSTSGTLKSVVAFESIAAGANLLTARNGMAGAGSQTAALSFGGDVSPPITGITEEYNGSGWGAGGALNTARKDLGSAGTQTAGLGAGGYNSGAKNESEEYNGSAWTEGDNLNSARYRLVGLGTQTAAMVMGGRGTPEPQPVVATVEDYNGTSWTTGTSLNTARQAGGGAGTNTAGLLCGGGATPTSAGTTNTANSEEWDGTSWSEGNNMPSAKRAFAGQNGIQTAAIMMGGAPNTTAVQTYDGTSWATSPATMVTQRHNGSGTINQPGTTGMAVGGSADPGPTASTEEYHKSINTITVAAFSSLNGPPNAVYGGGTGGTPTAAFLVGGYGTAPSPSANRAYYQLFDGTNWSEGPDLNTARVYLGAAGTQTAALAFGGRVVSGTTNNDLSEEYDGSSWTEGPNLNTARQFGGAAGTQTAALGTCGTPPGSTTNEEYDGSNWTSATAYPQSYGNQLRTTGTQTAAYCVGGPSYSTVTNTYDGTNWTAGPTCVTGVMEGNLNGTTSTAIHAGGGAGSSNYTATSQLYNSSVWYTGPNLSVGRAAMPSGPFSSSVSGSLFSGGPKGAPTYIGNQLEEYNGETTAVTASTLTTS